MDIITLEMGDFLTNCYVVRSTGAAKQCLVIDPGFSAEPLVELIREQSFQIERIILTHGHCDHIAGIKLLRENFDRVPACISSIDADMLTNDKNNLSWMTGSPLRLDGPDETFDPGDIIVLDELELKVLASPGHTPGGVSFYCAGAGVVFSGDTLFAGSIGRDDFPGGDRGALLSSIREQLFTLPEETKVYPGHGPETTIGQEKRTNPFLR